MLCSCTTPSVPSSDTTNHAHTTTNEATDGPQTGNATTTGDNNPDTRPRPTTTGYNNPDTLLQITTTLVRTRCGFAHTQPSHRNP
jgi:hypothetical protein